MDEKCFQEVIKVLDLIGHGFNKQICIIDKQYNVLWINAQLEKKGFKLNEIKGRFYNKVFNNADFIDKEDPAYKAINSGTTINTLKIGSDKQQYNIIELPIKNSKGEIEFVIEFTKNIDDQNAEEIHKLKDFIFERELKMVELKNKIKELQNN